MAAVMSDVEQLAGNPIVEEARKRFRRCSEWEATARGLFIDDLKFAEGDSDNGYQWPNAIKRSRDVDKRPCLTMNVTRQHNLQIVNQQRQNKSSVAIRATGGGATKASADVFSALMRRIEYQSNAQDAYQTACEYQVKAGYGCWRLVTDYAGPETFNQEIFIRRIWDPLSVFLDPDIQEKDGSDARFGFVFDTLPKDQFEEWYSEYADLASLQPLEVATTDDDWIIKDHVRICEYFRKVDKRDMLVSFFDYQGMKRKELLKSKMPLEVFDSLRQDPLTKTRPVVRTVVEWKLIAGNQVIDSTEWPGKYIPLIRVIGEETCIEGILDRKGHTRSMKDANRMYNYNAPLAINTPIPTPTGWSTMDQIKTGDWVLGENGEPAEVVGISPIFEGRKCYKITFDDGSSVVSDAGHLWQVEEKVKRIAKGIIWKTKTITTEQLVQGKHFILTPKELKLEPSPLLKSQIDPYVLGLWLGDGTAASGAVSSHQDDVEEEKILLSQLGYQTGATREKLDSKGVVFTILGLRGKLAAENLLDDKHIPASFLRASYEDRLAVVQGLMDTDGHFAPKINQCIFINTNKEIIDGFMELIRTLGIKPFVSKTKGTLKKFPNGIWYQTEDSYRVAFTADPNEPMFRLSRKRLWQQQERATHWRRTKRFGIESVIEVESVPVKCLTLDTPSHLFLAGRGMIPTHNSSQVEFVALQGKTPWVASAKAIEEYETMWNTANMVNHSVLIYNDVDDDNPERKIEMPQRTPPPSASPGYQMGMDTAFQQMMMTSGQWQNQMGMMGNERTGSAIEKRQQQSDTSVFHFQDNYEMALRHCGKQIIDLIPKVYQQEQVLRLMAEDGEEFEVEINPAARQAYQEFLDAQGKAVRRVLNPVIGQYDVEASVGPAYGTRREESVDALTLILTQNPGLTGVIGDLLLKNLNIKEAQEASQRLRRMVPPQALGQGPTPNEQQLQQRLDATTSALAKALDKYAKDQLKLAGKDQMRDIDAYDSETKRMAALKDMLPMDQEGLKDMIRQLVEESHKTVLAPIIQANTAGLKAEAGDTDQPGSQPGPGLGASDLPPHPAAKKAPDGEWYILDPTRRGKYLRIAPLAQQKAPGRIN